MVNLSSTGGSHRIASSSFAFSRSAAALAASRSPNVAAPKNSASTFLKRSRSWSSIPMPLSSDPSESRRKPRRQREKARHPHLFAEAPLPPVQRERDLHDRRDQFEHDQHDDRRFEP